MLGRKDSSPLARLIRLMAEERDMHRFLHLVTSDDQLMAEARALISGPAQPGTVPRCRNLCARCHLSDSEFQHRLLSLGSLMRSPEEDGDPYAVLGISPSSDADAVKAAFRRLCLRWHPDLNSVDPDAGENFQRIKNAYEQILTRSGGSGGAAQAPVWVVTPRENGFSPRSRWRSLLPLLLIVFLLVVVGEIVVRRHDAGNETTPAPVAVAAPVLPSGHMERYPVPGVRPNQEDASAPAVAADVAEVRNDTAMPENASSGEGAVATVDLASVNATGVAPGEESGARRGEYLHVVPVRVWAELAAAERTQAPVREDAPAAPLPVRNVAAGEEAARATGRGPEHDAVEDVEAVQMRLDAFLHRYVRDYESRSVDAFLAHFEPGAMENGRLIANLRHEYARTFAAIPRLHYAIEPQRWIVSKNVIALKGTFRIDGLSRDGSVIASQGRLNMELVPYHATYRVMRLQYEFN